MRVAGGLPSAVAGHAACLRKLRDCAVPGAHTDVILGIIAELEAAAVDRKVLEETKVGVEVNNAFFRRHSDERVRARCAALVQRWRTCVTSPVSASPAKRPRREAASSVVPLVSPTAVLRDDDAPWLSVATSVPLKSTKSEWKVDCQYTMVERKAQYRPASPDVHIKKTVKSLAAAKRAIIKFLADIEGGPEYDIEIDEIKGDLDKAGEWCLECDDGNNESDGMESISCTIRPVLR